MVRKTRLKRLTNKLKHYYIGIKTLCYFLFKKEHKTDEIKRVANNNLELELPCNVYDIHGTLGDYVKKYHRFHNNFKIRFVETGLFFIKHFCKDILIKDVPKKPQFTNLRLFDDSFEESLYLWEYFRSNIDKSSPEQLDSVKLKEQFRTSGSVKNLRTVKEMYLTGMKMDTAYLAFHDILMFNLAKRMNDHHGKNPTWKFYTSKHINDVRYFMTTGSIPQIQLNLSEIITQNFMKFIHNIELPIEGWRTKYSSFNSPKPTKKSKKSKNNKNNKNKKKNDIKTHKSKS